jgi:hypothetical protein
MLNLRRGAGKLVTTLTFALALAVGVAAQAQAAPHPFYGISSQTALEGGDYQRMAKADVGTLRATLNWPTVDPTKGEGEYNWSDFDSVVAESARNGITVLPFVFGSPKWVASGLDRRSCGSRCTLFAPRGKAALDAWGRFVGDAVDRYGRGGEFWAENPGLPKHPVRAWQIWNEQNSKSFYQPKPSTKGYAKLLDAASRAIRAADRGADVVLGGMAELAGASKAVPGHRYLGKLYRRKGVERDFDGIAAGEQRGTAGGAVRRRDPRRQLRQHLGDRDRLELGQRGQSAQRRKARPGAAAEAGLRLLRARASADEDQERDLVLVGGLDDVDLRLVRDLGAVHDRREAEARIPGLQAGRAVAPARARSDRAAGAGIRLRPIGKQVRSRGA